MVEYSICNECTEKYCVCDKDQINYLTKLNEKQEVSLDYELNY